ncbi:unnamed protein product [Spirodela intermedia]|uniref:Uncharacterized protein n=1 Tax=Spirodela intermedia TaxID=51605 RepID=A0A7I8ISE0_SPIIN|nr:unnamed protein product [Spirodela intermedia]CAA6660488.1 unnamed protein product [Spirodela intermedia]
MRSGQPRRNLVPLKIPRSWTKRPWSSIDSSMEPMEEKKPSRCFPSNPRFQIDGRCCCKIILYLVILLLLVGVVALMVWIFINTKWHIKVAVESATLSRFDLDGNATLRYNLTLGVSIRNANRADVSYDKISVTALNNGTAFSSADVPAFNQGWKTTTMVYPAFQGQWPKGGVHNINVTFKGNIRIRYQARDKSWRMRTNRYSMEANCALRIPERARRPLSTRLYVTLGIEVEDDQAKSIGV